MSKAEERAEKEMGHTARECLAGRRTHIRVGWWTGDQGCTVTVVGHARDLHGTLCTCCARREES